MTFNKKVLAGLVAFAAASTSAQAVTVAANDGWTLGVSGSVNQFITLQNDDNNSDNDNATIANGLLPAFLSFDFTAPTMNGLDIAAHISISPGTNNDSDSANMEQREVYFTVNGSFGQILAGKALGLYGSHNILTEQTLFGVGYGPAEAGGSTSLGGIGLGYDYAAWRSQVKWTSNDMSGFKVAFAVMHAAGADSINLGVDSNDHRINNGMMPHAGLNAVTSSEDLRYEADLSYAGSFEGGSYTAWLSGMMQDQDQLAEDKQAWTVGATAAIAGFEFMAQYSDSEGATAGSAAVSGSAAVLESGTAGTTGYVAAADAVLGSAAVASRELEWTQYVVQAGYRFGGTTLVSANYSEIEDKSSGRDRNNEDAERYTVGVYHDVNANLKLVAEYTKVEADNSDMLDRDLISIGGFVFF